MCSTYVYTSQGETLGFILSEWTWPAFVESTPVRKPTTASRMPLPEDGDAYKSIVPDDCTEWWLIWGELKQQLVAAEAAQRDFENGLCPADLDLAVNIAKDRESYLNDVDAAITSRFPNAETADRRRMALQASLDGLAQSRSCSAGPVRASQVERAMGYVLRQYAGRFDEEAFRKDAGPLVGTQEDHQHRRTAVLAKTAKCRRELAAHIKEVSRCLCADLPPMFRGMKLDGAEPQVVAEVFIDRFIGDWRTAASCHGPAVDVFGREVATLPSPREWKRGFEALKLGELPKKASLFRHRVCGAELDSVSATL